MAEKVTFRISSAAAPYVGSDKPKEMRLQAAAGRVKLPLADFAVLIYYLCHDSDPDVRQTAVATMRGLDPRTVAEIVANPDLHPRILDALVRLHGRNPRLAPVFAAHPMLSEQAAKHLAQVPTKETAPAPAQPGTAGETAAAGQSPAASAETPAGPAAAGESKPAGRAAAPGTEPRSAEPAAEPGGYEDAPVDESGDEFLSKYQLAQNMGVGDKIKMALTGDKEWRTILIKDSNKLVSGAVVKNPRISENEILAIAKSAVQNEEIMRVICANKEWVKNAAIRKALVTNNKTPLPHALRYVSSLTEKELGLLAKSKNVNSVIASQARRILMTKKDGK